MSGENYLGFGRTQSFASPGGAIRDMPRIYERPARLRLNEWALSGDWTVKNEAVVLNKPNGGIAYRFHARDVHLVMGPAALRVAEYDEIMLSILSGPGSGWLHEDLPARVEVLGIPLTVVMADAVTT